MLKKITYSTLFVCLLSLASSPATFASNENNISNRRTWKREQAPNKQTWKREQTPNRQTWKHEQAPNRQTWKREQAPNKQTWKHEQASNKQISKNKQNTTSLVGWCVFGLAALAVVGGGDSSNSSMVPFSC